MLDGGLQSPVRCLTKAWIAAFELGSDVAPVPGDHNRVTGLKCGFSSALPLGDDKVTGSKYSKDWLDRHQGGIGPGAGLSWRARLSSKEP